MECNDFWKGLHSKVVLVFCPMWKMVSLVALNTIPSTLWLQKVSSSNIDVVIDGGGAASIGGQQIITIPDPITGEPVQHLVQTIIDPETGQQTEVITNLTTNTVAGITISMKCQYVLILLLALIWN